jgi:hypothetical protein
MPINSEVGYWRGQANDLTGGVHPPGWASGQRYSTTSAQWHSQYDAEVAAYNDMVSQRDTWIGRANNAWGPSRVWSSGASWESMYGSELTLYNAQVVATAAAKTSILRLGVLGERVC